MTEFPESDLHRWGTSRSVFHPKKILTIQYEGKKTIGGYEGKGGYFSVRTFYQHDIFFLVGKI